jgi:hypothetical protein
VRNVDFLFPAREKGLTRGNISSHVSKLEAAGYLDVLNKIYRSNYVRRLFDKQLNIWNDTFWNDTL